MILAFFIRIISCVIGIAYLSSCDQVASPAQTFFFSESEDSEGCSLDQAPPPDPDSGTLQFSVEEDVDPCSLEGEVVGGDPLTIYETGEGEYAAEVPEGEQDIIVTAGTLEIQEEPEGGSLVNFQDNSRGIRLNGVSVNAGEVTNLETLEIPPMGRLKGGVRLFGQTNHALIQAVIPGTQFSAWTDATGNFAFILIPVGTHSFSFASDGYFPYTIDNVRVESGAVTSLETVFLFPRNGEAGQVVINNGDSFTNNPTVDVSIVGGGEAILMAISDEPAFVNVQPVVFNNTTTYTFDSTGDNQLFVKLINADGIETVISSSITVDTQAPTGSTIVEGEPLAVSSRLIQLVMQFVDDLTSVADIMVSENSDFTGASWQEFNEIINFIVSASDGSKTIYVKARNSAGNVSETSSVTTLIDVTAPEVSSLVLNPAIRDGFLNIGDASSAVAIIESIDGDGYDTVRYAAISASDTCDENVSFSSSAISSDDAALSDGGTFKICVALSDIANNPIAYGASANFVVDKTPASLPSFSISDSNGGSQSGFTDTLTVDVTINSCPADVSKILITESNGTPAASSITTTCSDAAGAFQHVFSDTIQGAKSLYLFTVDAAGNVSSTFQSTSITYDSVDPIISSVQLTELNSDSFRLSWTTNEPAIFQVDYGPISGSPSLQQSSLSYTSNHYATLTGLTSRQINYFTILATDRVGKTALTTEDNETTIGVTKSWHETLNHYLGGGHKGVVACDVNNDGADDLVVGETTETNVHIIFGGTGLVGSSFDIPTDTDVDIDGSSGDFGEFVYCLDYNGDNIDDLLVGIQREPVSLFLGPITADTNEASADVEFDDGGSGTLTKPTIGNFNGDAFDDVAVCIGNSCGIYLGSGTPASSPSPDLSISVTSSQHVYYTATAADVDSDGYDDFIVGNYNYDHNFVTDTGQVTVYRGGSTLNSTADYNFYGQAASHRASVFWSADIDGDGKNDYLIKRNSESASGNIDIVFGMNASEWATASNEVIIPTSGLYFSGFSSPNYSTSRSHSFIAFGDINSDGKQDVFIGHNSGAGEVYVYLGRSQGDWSSLGAAITTSEADFKFVGADSSDRFGSSIDLGNFDGNAGLELFFSAPLGNGSADSASNAGDAGIIYFTYPTNLDDSGLQIKLQNEF